MKLSGINIDVEEHLWLSYFGVNERMANGFRRKRAFLVGDAAHCHSPVGGQGMNIAENLAWKLSTRESMVKAVLETTSNIAKTVFSQSPITSVLRQTALNITVHVPMIQNMFIVDFHLDKSSILSFTTKKTKLIQPGQYIKETKVLMNRDASIDLPRKTIYQILREYGKKYCVFFLLSRHSWQNEPNQKTIEGFVDGISKYETSCQGFIAQSITQYSGYFDGKDKKSSAKNVEYYIDTHAISSSDSLSSRLGFTPILLNDKTPSPPAAFIVVRPDRYIAYSQLVYSKEDLSTGFEFLDTYLSKL
ncbi:unnamed protein product [Cunninghamella blakesleeana]